MKTTYRKWLMRPYFFFVCALVPMHLFSQESSTPSYSPSARLSVEDGWNLFLTADWLYFQPNETGLGYTVSQEGFDENIPEYMGFGNVVNPKFSWESGFRVGAGYNIPRDQWILETAWTWYEGKAQNSTASSEDRGSLLFPTWIHPNIYNDQNIFSCDSADGDLLLHVNIIDLNVGRQCRLSKWFSILPFLGLRNSWIYQTYNVDYQDLSYYDISSTTIVPALSDYSVHMINNFWGIGPRIGVDIDLGLGAGWSLFGDLGLSLLYGTFKLSHREDFVGLPLEDGDSLEGVIFEEKNNFHAGRFATDIQLGMRWSFPLLKERARILLETGWEHHMFFSQNQMMRFVDGQNWGTFVQNQGDLYLKGWKISLGLYF